MGPIQRVLFEVDQIMNTYNVYVIELDKAVMNVRRFKKANPNHNPAMPCVYVGQTARTPEERLRQHLLGECSNAFVKRYGKELKPRLYEKHNTVATRTEAEAKEQWLAERLRFKGYGVWWN
jgi:hypothetical protein